MQVIVSSTVLWDWIMSTFVAMATLWTVWGMHRTMQKLRSHRRSQVIKDKQVVSQPWQVKPPQPAGTSKNSLPHEMVDAVNAMQPNTQYVFQAGENLRMTHSLASCPRCRTRRLDRFCSNCGWDMMLSYSLYAANASKSVSIDFAYLRNCRIPAQRREYLKRRIEELHQLYKQQASMPAIEPYTSVLQAAEAKIIMCEGLLELSHADRLDEYLTALPKESI